MSSTRAPAKRPERDTGPAEEGDTVRVERDGDGARGIVRAVETYDIDGAEDRLVVEIYDAPELNTARSNVTKVTGADAELIRSLVGGEE